MGCDIHAFVEVKTDGKWERIDDKLFSSFYGGEKTSEPFGDRNYNRFAFLADVRNNSGIIPLSEPKGLPDNSEYLNTPLSEPQRYSYSGYDNGTAYTKKGEIECDIDYHSESYLTLKELTDFDYDKTFEDLRVSKVLRGENTVMMGSIFDEKAKQGEGRIRTYRDFLGEGFFNDVDVLKTLGEPENVRIIFWFDN